MRQHAEVELKWALDADGHARLAERLAVTLGAPRMLEQDNRFFDSAALHLRAATCNVRLRTENGRLLLTCKRKAPAVHGAHHHDEWERWLDGMTIEAVTMDVLAGLLPEPMRTVIGDAPLVPQGGFANRRLEYHNRDDLLCLDRTTFPGGRIDHELEIETADPLMAQRRWGTLLDAWGIAHPPQPLTKFARYLACRAGA